MLFPCFVELHEGVLRAFWAARNSAAMAVGAALWGSLLSHHLQLMTGVLAVQMMMRRRIKAMLFCQENDKDAWGTSMHVTSALIVRNIYCIWLVLNL